MELNDSLYGQDCVFIANDWHASLVPVYLAGAPGHFAALLLEAQQHKWKHMIML